MSEAAPKLQLHSYDEDFSAWSEEQSHLLKARSRAGLDWDNLAEEIESLGRSQRSEIRNRLTVILLHLLKWEYQPSKRKLGWKASILEARRQLNRELRESPSLRSYPAEVLAEQFEVARLKAAAETELPLETFPTECPYPVPHVLDEDVLPGGES
jgi:Domain of unknown function DUF29